MNGFIFASGVNDPNHGNDANGAFIPGARAFKKINNISQDIFYFDHREKDAALRRKIVDKMMSTPCDDPDGFDVVAYFGHGIQRGLPSAGFYSEDRAGKARSDVQDLAQAISSTCKHNVVVILYACSAGKLPACFASALATAMNSFDATVFGHTCAGHAFTNPYVTVFATGHVGRFVVEPGSTNWKSWVKAIHAGNTNDPTKHPLWATFPFMGEDEVRASIGDYASAGVCTTTGSGGWW